jgi:hypothetical protein
MLNMLTNFFLGRRRTGLAGLFRRGRRGGVANTMKSHRGASALGTIATIAAPILIRKLMARRASHAAA